ncbi:hypothetical protein J1G42_15645 [Cellulomonas sp. zg-ZUI222]|uniref:Uncharacterized protein n=1 Tax=Cellulomonas wangleii TaxID=2816956 RepID=A0ABX8DBH3_9CELL|nr:MULTISPECIES: hypothetical protein [Cellulomonas]MBO0901626.1 hypothetical protein [Cellulomonas sp. zg-ZUI22]MBO0922255.1 hypothetical protein [Cellulomonas wangleii]MBO0925950.1 hypothetical protein [Cellulomonas wangleii]QVI63252.1 hypothetical protein KG103_04980 [Cellulomonas wangleii]
MNTLVATALVAGVRWSQRLPGPTIESPEEGSPGLAGFIATFVLALAVILLAVSFSRRMRRATHRERLRGSAGEGTVGDGTVGERAGGEGAGAEGAGTAASSAGAVTASGDVEDPPAAPPAPGR